MDQNLKVHLNSILEKNVLKGGWPTNRSSETQVFEFDPRNSIDDVGRRDDNTPHYYPDVVEKVYLHF